jgi:hypothetical protein
MGSLESDRPDLLGEWDYKKNGDTKPGDIGSTSHRKVWWICPVGHGYLANVGNRARNGTNCPVCSNRVVLTGFNDLATACPELALEWNRELNGNLRPEAVPRTYSKKVWWTCPVGHQYQAAPASRSKNSMGTGCNVCAGKVALAGFNDLLSKCPEIASEWNYEKNGTIQPDSITWSSGRDVWWKCKANHEFNARVNTRTSSGRVGKCPVCLNQRVYEGVNDLITTHPELAAEWNCEKNVSVLPSSISAGSNRKIWWTCPVDKRHEWEATPASRSGSRKGSCPVCLNRIVMPGLNDFATIWPNLAREWHESKNGDTLPTEISRGTSTSKYWWTCAQGHDFLQTVNARTNLGAGCPYCTNQKVLAGFNDLQSVRPDIAAEWHRELNVGISLVDVIAGSKRRVWWQCSRYTNHSWKASISNRTKLSATGCPICANKQVLTGFNDLQTVRPDIAAEWHPTLNEGISPNSIVFGSWTRVWWQCPDDSSHAYRTRVVNRTSEKQNGCPTCAQTGFDASSPGIFYMLEHTLLGAKKVGITNGNRDQFRLKQFQQDGWEVLTIHQCQEGRKILELETVMLRWIRKDLNLPVFLSRAEMSRTGGFSETFEGDAVSNHELLRRAKDFAIELGIV